MLVIFGLTGCLTTGERIPDSDFTTGCYVIESEAKLGAFNQQGAIETCKVKCGEKLPPNFKYTYNNIRTGCKVEINADEVKGND